MAAELDQTYHGWPHQELLSEQDSQDVTIAQILDQGSISFGRYAVETLAWEKRSVFTHNRCQEELEKLKAPGLVAQKKAYFEAYYKRIRALKALQANEQAVLVVDYRGDDSDSCKTGEVEDENFERETLRNGATNVAIACLKEHAAEAALGMESSGAFCCRYSDSKSVVTCPDFSTRTIEGDVNSMNAHLNNDMIREPAGACTNYSKASLKEIDTDKNSIDSLQCGHLDPESSVSYDDLWRTDIEDAELKKNCSNALQVGHMSKESTLPDSPRRIEEIELLKSLCSDDDEWNVKESRDAQCSIDGRTGAELNGPDYLMLKITSELPPVDNHTIGEAKVLSNKQINHSLTPRIKESVSSVRKTIKTECRTKSEAVKASHRPKHLLQKTIVVEKKTASVSNAPSGRLPSRNKSTSDASYRPHKVHSSLSVGKEGSNTRLSNALCNRLPSKNKSASVSSNRPLNESSSSVTISCPRSFATQRRSTTSASIREIGPQNSYSKSLNASIHASKQLSMQSTLVKGHAANGVKNAGLEKKSHHGESPKRVTLLNSHTAVPRARDGLLQRPVARSINLPAVSKYRLTSSVSSGLKEDRLKEGKSNARHELFAGILKTVAAPLARTNKTNLRKQASSETTGLLLDGKKSSCILGRRQEVKPWR